MLYHESYIAYNIYSNNIYLVNIKFSYFQYGILFHRCLVTTEHLGSNDSYHERWTAAASKTAGKRQNEIGIPKLHNRPNGGTAS